MGVAKVYREYVTNGVLVCVHVHIHIKYMCKYNRGVVTKHVVLFLPLGQSS